MQATASASIQHNTQPSERLCGGCKLTVESESGGIVVAFGSSLWHVDCFKCAKCSNRVTADTNLLLLSDGSPVCTSCSYNCNVCKKPILDEAIMTGEESYHAACFTCRTCSRRIDELVFAKTSQGIYCMACHNERVARSRRHAEAKKKAKNAAARKDSGKPSSSSRLRENAPGPIDASRERQVDSPLGTPTNGNTNTNTPVLSPSASGHLSPSTNNSLSPSTSAHSNASQYFPTDGFVDQTNAARSPAPAPIVPRARVDSLPPQSGIDDGPRRQSAEESPRSPQPSAGLAVPTSRQDRRRSMLAGAPLPSGVSSPDSISRSASPQIPAAAQSTLPWARDDRRGVSPARPQPPNRGTSTEEVPTNLDASSYGYPQRSMSLPESAKTPPHHVPVDPIVTGRADAASPSVPPSVPPKEVGNDAEGFSPATVEDQQAQPNSAVIAPSIPPIRFSINEANILELLISADDSSADEQDEPKPTTGDAGEMLQSPSPHTPGFSPGLSEGSTLGSNTVTPVSAVMNVPSAIILDDYDANDDIMDERRSPSADGASGSGRSSFDNGSSEFHTTVEDTLVPSVDTHDSRRKSSMPKDMPYVNGLLGGGGNNRATANGDVVARRLREALADSNERNVAHVKLDTKLVEAILEALQQQREGYTTLKSKLDGMRRASQQVIDGLSVAQSEYDQELASRREAQAEVQRLKAQLHGQNARLTQYTAEEKTREMKELLSRDLNENLHGLQHDVAKLKVERDLTLAEMEELNTTKQSGNVVSEGSLSRSLTTRLEGLKSQYRRDLEPLTEQREALQREVAELKQTRDVFLEEVTALNARNEELVELNRDTERRLELLHGSPPERPPKVPTKGPLGYNNGYGSPSLSGSPSPSQSYTSGGGSATTASSANTIAMMVDDREREDTRFIKVVKADYLDAAQANARKGFKWNNKKPSQQNLAAVQERGPGGVVALGSQPDKPRNNFEHSFQQISVLRVARCDHCNDKMWGSQLRCSNCSTAIHTRCIHSLQTSCRPPQYQSLDDNVDMGPLPPALFGRDLIEQTRADAARGDDRSIPVIVEKCINAVEKSGMDYEGIYRKSGGSSLSKSITALFERGNYDSFDLEDTEVFNDISSITSVLKSYFRALPNPLLTHTLHEQFIGASGIREPGTKTAALADLVHQLPREHFQTLQFLMLHLHRVQASQEENLMNARNLGVVFGPTLMRSDDSGREFADMAGKAMTIEWLIEHANVIFADQ